MLSIGIRWRCPTAIVFVYYLCFELCRRAEKRLWRYAISSHTASILADLLVEMICICAIEHDLAWSDCGSCSSSWLCCYESSTIVFYSISFLMQNELQTISGNQWIRIHKSSHNVVWRQTIIILLLLFSMISQVHSVDNQSIDGDRECVYSVYNINWTFFFLYFVFLICKWLSLAAFIVCQHCNHTLSAFSDHIRRCWRRQRQPFATYYQLKTKIICLILNKLQMMDKPRRRRRRAKAVEVDGNRDGEQKVSALCHCMSMRDTKKI